MEQVPKYGGEAYFMVSSLRRLPKLRVLLGPRRPDNKILLQRLWKLTGVEVSVDGPHEAPDPSLDDGGRAERKKVFCDCNCTSQAPTAKWSLLPDIIIYYVAISEFLLAYFHKHCPISDLITRAYAGFRSDV